MTDHTPGPWFFSVDEAKDCPCHRNSGLALVDTGRESDWPIARLCEWNNVALIAAAPDLLAALKNYENADSVGLTESERRAITLAAIAKAEGHPKVHSTND